MAKKTNKELTSNREAAFFFYLPENILEEIDKIYSELSEDEARLLDKWKLLYIVHLIVYLPAASKKQRNVYGYVNLNSTKLNNKIKNYSSYIEFLITNGVIDGNSSYSNNPSSRFSKSYKLAALYRDKNIIAVSIPKSKFRTTLVNHVFIDTSKEEVAIQYKFLRNLKVNMVEAISYLNTINNTLYAQGDFDGIAHFNLRKQEMKVNLLRLSVGNIEIKVDNTSGRVHSNITSLKKELRHFLKYKGESLVGIDIKTSQPYIMQRLLSEYFWFPHFTITAKEMPWLGADTRNTSSSSTEDTKSQGGSVSNELCTEDRKELTAYDVKKRVREELQRGIEDKGIRAAFTMLRNRDKIKINKEIQEYRALINESDIYNDFSKTARELLENDTEFQNLWIEYLHSDKKRINGLNRDAMKLIVMIAQYAPKNSTTPLTALARYLYNYRFPEITHFMDDVKSLWIKSESGKSVNSYNGYAILLQAIESYIMMEKVLPRINSEYPEIPIMTIHDSILTTATNTQVVKGILEDEFGKAIGVKPVTKIEDYSIDAINYENLPFVNLSVEMDDTFDDCLRDEE